MNGNVQYAGQYTLPPDVDPQGVIGAFLGRMAGGAIGKHFGGGAGQTAGGIAGGALGAWLPFSADPGIAPQQATPVSELEMQSFWGTFQKIANAVRTGYDVGHNLGLFQAGPQLAPQQAGPVSDLEMQSFWDTFKKIASRVGDAARTGYNVGHSLGLFEAGPGTAADSQVSEVELQNFWNVLTKIGGVAKGLSQVTSGLGQAAGGIYDAGKTLGLAQAGVPGAAQAQSMSPDQAYAILRQVSPTLQELLRQPSGTMH